MQDRKFQRGLSVNSQRRICKTLTVIVLGAILGISLFVCGCQMAEKRKPVVIPSDLSVPNKITSGVLIESQGGEFELASWSVTAYDISEGRKLWEFDDMAPCYSAKIYGKEVFAPLHPSDYERMCRIAAFDARTGKNLREYNFWKIDSLGDVEGVGDRPNWHFWISELEVSDKYIVSMSIGNKCKAIDLRNGQIVFDEFISGEMLHSTILALVDSTLFIGGSNVSAYDLNSGELVWQRNLKSAEDLAITSQGLICTTNEPNKHYLYLLDVNSGRTIWRSDNSDSWGHRIAANNNRLLCNTEEVSLSGEYQYGPSGLYCIDLKTGQKLWRFTCPASYAEISTPLILDGVVYFDNTDGYFYALDLATGEAIGRHDSIGGEGNPLTDGNYVYILYDGEIYKFQKAVKGNVWPAPVILPP